jgi:hypothetical protein
MKRLKIVSLFIITVFVGLYLINELLIGLPGTECRCADDLVMQQECEAACENAQGCDFYHKHSPGSCYYPSTCVSYVANYCNEETGNHSRVIVGGYHYAYHCWECNGL